MSSSEGAERQATPERAATNAPSQRENLSGEERKALSALEASGLPEDLAIPLIRAEVLHRLYREALAAGTAAGASALAKWIVNDVARELGAAESIGEAAASGRPWGLLEPVPLADLVARVEAGTLGRRGGLSALAYLVEHGGSAEDAVRETALDEIDDVDVLRPLITDTLNAFPDRVEAYRGGKTGLAGFFVGQVMKASGGKANPKMVNQLVKKALDG